MKNNKLFLATALAALAFTTYSCKGDKATEGTEAETAETEAAAPAKPLVFAEFVDLDLSSNGMPMVIKAPKDAKIIKSTISEDEIFVYGGERFKLTLKKMSGTAENSVATMKELQADKDLNPSFDKLVEDLPTSYLKASKDGTLSFITAVTTSEESCIMVQEGMIGDQSPDQFTDYSADDIRLMYEAAKTLKAK